MKLYLYSCTIVLICVNIVFAQSQNTENTLKLDDPANAPSANIEDFAFMEGYWKGEALGGVVEEIWSAPSGGTMMGMFRLINDGKIAFYELQIISADSNGTSLKVKHFNADFSGWEEKSDYANFPLVRTGNQEAFFSGLTYKRAAEDSLNVFLVIKRKNSERTEETFHMTRYGD